MANFFARIRAYDPRNGALVQRYSMKLGDRVQTFLGGDIPTWYEVTPAQADILRTVRSGPHLVFHVVSPEEKKAIDDQETLERLAALRLAGATASIVAPPAPQISLASGRASAYVGEAQGQ